MADSSYLTKVVEPYVAAWVSQRIGVDLKPGKKVVGQRIDGTSVQFAFDGLSADGTTGLLASTCHTLKPAGTHKLHRDASVLLQAPFSTRIMAFVRDDVRVNFLNKCDGLLPLHKIDMLVCSDLPEDMLAAVATFQATAQAEVGNTGKRQWTIGGRRR